MRLFDPRKRLLRVLDTLAFYNDKGTAYARHAPERVAVERERGLADARALSANMSADALPREVRLAIENGDAASDASGRYANALRAHLRGGKREA